MAPPQADIVETEYSSPSTIRTVAARRFLRVNPDGWHEAYDVWYDYRSPDIFPVGLCEAAGMKLNRPRRGYTGTARLDDPMNLPPCGHPFVQPEL